MPAGGVRGGACGFRAFFPNLLNLDRSLRALPRRVVRARGISRTRNRGCADAAAWADSGRAGMGADGMVGAQLEHQRAEFLPRARRLPAREMDPLAGR